MKNKIYATLILSFLILSLHAQTSDPILGVWERTDGFSLEYRESSNGTLEGFIIELGPLKPYGYYVGEKVVVLNKVAFNSYVGQTKKRWTTGESEWIDRNMTLENDVLIQKEGSKVISMYKRKFKASKACPNFLGIGKLAGMLEMGAVNNYDDNWMVSTIDYATIYELGQEDKIGFRL